MDLARAESRRGNQWGWDPCFHSPIICFVHLGPMVDLAIELNPKIFEQHSPHQILKKVGPEPNAWPQLRFQRRFRRGSVLDFAQDQVLVVRVMTMMRIRDPWPRTITRSLEGGHQPASQPANQPHLTSHLPLPNLIPDWHHHHHHHHHRHHIQRSKHRQHHHLTLSAGKEASALRTSELAKRSRHWSREAPEWIFTASGEKVKVPARPRDEDFVAAKQNLQT